MKTRSEQAIDEFDELDRMLERAEALAKKHGLLDDVEGDHEAVLELLERAMQLRQIEARQVQQHRMIEAAREFVASFAAGRAAPVDPAGLSDYIAAPAEVGGEPFHGMGSDGRPLPKPWPPIPPQS